MTQSAKCRQITLLHDSQRTCGIVSAKFPAASAFLVLGGSQSLVQKTFGFWAQSTTIQIPTVYILTGVTFDRSLTLPSQWLNNGDHRWSPEATRKLYHYCIPSIVFCLFYFSCLVFMGETKRQRGNSLECFFK